MSEFIVSARKYRPQKFSDVVGQAHVSQTLKNALRTDHIAHAFLFCGPRGVGKTTNARILAKILNCTNRTPDFEACETCDSCRAFAQSASFNIFELDAASNNSVEHVRSLVDQTRIPPQQGKYKVFIIDEVHMLSQAAFNAFLKTLEEPPAHAIFILATTEKHKIIPTILSRCQIFDFRRIQIPDIVSHLQNICATEGIKADADSLHIIAQKADGALRDALSIFDRIVSASVDRTIHYADVIENLNVLDYDYFFKMTDALLAEDLPSVLNTYEDVMRRGFEGDTFIVGLAEHLRNILVSKDLQTLKLLEVGDNLRNRYQNQAALSSTSFVLTALNLCNDCDVNYKMARHKRLHVEMALIKMTFIGRAVDLSAAPQTVVIEKKTDVGSKLETKSTTIAPPQYKDEKTSQTTAEEPQVTPSSEETPGPAVPNIKTNLPADLISSMKIGSLDAIAAQIEEEENILKQVVSKLSVENLSESWKKYAETHESPSTKAALQAAQLDLNEKKVTARVGSTLMVGIIQQEYRLPEFLRFDLNDSALLLEIVYDETLAPQETKAAPVRKFLTPRDKLRLMMEVNPLVKDLAIRLNLKPDE
ncbi:MAG: DNA polymerase III subunit gamma/tau [Saprospiraceae bacterium]|nr:DNA polymerase III subunit gamma/tau [Saprospiraceae bacterium]